MTLGNCVQVALCLYVHFGARVLLQLEVFLGLLLARLTDAKSQAPELQEAALEVRLLIKILCTWAPCPQAARQQEVFLRLLRWRWRKDAPGTEAAGRGSLRARGVDLDSPTAAGCTAPALPSDACLQGLLDLCNQQEVYVNLDCRTWRGNLHAASFSLLSAPQLLATGLVPHTVVCRACWTCATSQPSRGRCTSTSTAAPSAATFLRPCAPSSPSPASPSAGP